jgi:predicted Zn-ribbon and HTH transcriptional regulator
MANNKSITVKVATAKVIKALETKSAELTKQQALYVKEQESNKAEQDKYEKEITKYQKDLAKALVPHLHKYTSGGFHFRSYSNTINVDINIPSDGIALPVEPQRPVNKYTVISVRESLDEVNNAIRILKMTDEETVSTSTFNKISQYL